MLPYYWLHIPYIQLIIYSFFCAPAKQKRFVMKKIILSLFLFVTAAASHAQLVINELSQGPTGNQEYVELLVTGTPTCGGSNTVDLRGWIIDDNNSWHAAGSGTGIAGGHVRFDSIAQWSSVKIGTLILVYNDADASAATLALTDDVSDANGDCVYIIPISSSVLQKNTTLPGNNGTMSTYGVAGTTYSGTGTWTILGMSNNNDAFHTVSPANYSAAYFAVGWANNTTAVNVYFGADQGGQVIQMLNLSDNNPFNAANWVDTAAALETPGAPNNAANAAWIAGLNNNCQPLTPPTISFNNPAPLSCGASNTVIIASSTTIGATFTWSNGTIGPNDTVTSGGTYRVTVSDAGHVCSSVDSITITSSSSLIVSASGNSTTCGNSNGTATVSVTSGTATGYLWNTGLTTPSISNLAAGTYTVTVTGTGGCTATASATVTTSGGPSVTISAVNTSFCSGDSTAICTTPANFVSYQWNVGTTISCTFAKASANYYVTVTDVNGCTAESNHVAIAVHPSPSVSISVNGDTLSAYGAVSYQWYLNNGIINGADDSMYIAVQSGNYTVQVTDSNGCTASSNVVPVNHTGINELSSTELNIYPNPSTGNWVIEVAENVLGAGLEVLDNSGRLVYAARVESLKTTINADLARGIYLLKVTSGEAITTRKLIRL